MSELRYRNMEIVDFYDWQWKDIIVNDDNMYVVISTLLKKIYDSGGVILCSFNVNEPFHCAIIKNVFYKNYKLYCDIEFVESHSGFEIIDGLKTGLYKFDINYKTKKRPISIGDSEYKEISSISSINIIKKEYE